VSIPQDASDLVCSIRIHGLQPLTITDYADPIYRRLAEVAQDMIFQDPELQPWTFKQGMTYVCDGRPSRFTTTWTEERDQAKLRKGFAESTKRSDVFHRIHGSDALLPSMEHSDWNMGFSNMTAAFIDAEEGIRVYYQRCLRNPSISFRCGVPVKEIVTDKGEANGVLLESGEQIDADLVVVAAGAWSAKLVSLGQRVSPIGHEVVWFKVTPEEEARWKNMSITTNLSTGLNIFPPYRGEVKVLRRSPGFVNTITVPNPENSAEKMRISYPRTIVDNPTDEIPWDAEVAIRKNLREIMPPLADRAFDRTKICWCVFRPYLRRAC
jgi:sarcosine oxidase / L-pipecolate oxidase